MIKKSIYYIFSLLAITFYVFGYYFSSPSLLAKVDGGCQDSSSPYMAQYFDDDRRITFCSDGDAYTGEIRSQIFKGKSEIFFSYSGYTNNEKVSIRLISNNGRVLNLNLPQAGERWVEYKLTIPKEFVGTELRLVAFDDAIDKFGWVGLTNIEFKKVDEKFSFLFKTISILFFLIIFYALALYKLLPRYGLVDASALMIVLVGVLGNIVFYLYVLNKSLGNIFSISLITMSVAYAVNVVRKGRQADFKIPSCSQ
jgi:hypothetical protein